MKNEVVLAFSGGLDTSFCVPYLKEQGYRVQSLFVDTGGVSETEKHWITKRAQALGVEEHHSVDASQAVWNEVVVPLIWGGELYQQQYPLLCSDRYVIVRESLKLARSRKIEHFAHGCTGMGNDQVRFDLTVKALGDFEILAPIREIQKGRENVRAYETAYLADRGFSLRAKTSQYTINENLLGVTVSGGEIDEFKEPRPEAWQWTAHVGERPLEPLRLKIRFEQGVAQALDGERLEGPALLAQLNRRLAPYGVGRGIYTGDTTIGLKGRIIFEAPGLSALLKAHRALEEAVNTQAQSCFKPVVAQRWVELVYKGFFYEPLKFDLEALLASSQRVVNGTVTLLAEPGSLRAVALDSPHILQAKSATYAQSADWGAEEAEGFIKLFGMNSGLSAQINPRALLDR